MPISRVPTKTCPKCHLPKLLTEFYVAETRSDGVRTYCKQCEAEQREKDSQQIKAYNQAYYAENKQQLVEAMSRYYIEHKPKINEYGKSYYRNRREHQLEKDILTRVKFRAKKLGIPFNLEVTDITVPSTCPVLGIEIFCVSRNRKGGGPNSPSLDRIEPHKGYTKGNVRVISNRANTLKLNASVEELELVLADLKRIQRSMDLLQQVSQV